MAYGIIRAEKVKLAKLGSGLQEHHQRSDKDGVYNNPDIDLNLSKSNVEFIHSDDFRNSMYDVIKKHNITRKIRPDAVGLIDGFTTVSGDFFKDKSKEQIVSYFRDMLPLIEREFGPIISATLHCDEMAFNEKNYHMHFATIPIVSDEKGNYCLSAKKVMGNQKDYIERQDRFYDEYFKSFGLERGISAKETKAKHISTNRWKADQTKEIINDFKYEIEELKDDKKIMTLQIKQEQKRLQSVKEQTDKATSNFMAIDSILSKITDEYSKKKQLNDELDINIKKSNMLLRSQQSTIETNKEMLKKQEFKIQSLKQNLDFLVQQINILKNQKKEINDWFGDNDDAAQALIDKRALDLIYNDYPDLANLYIDKACDMLNDEHSLECENIEL